MSFFRTGLHGYSGHGVISITQMGGAPGGAAAAPRWYNPLDSVAIDARIAAGGLWAWRAQANDNVTWGPGPANYAASLIDEAQGLVLVEGFGAVPWAAATGWGFVAAATQYFDTNIMPVNNQQWVAFLQFANHNLGVDGRPLQVISGGAGFGIRNRINIDVRYSNGFNLIVAPALATGNLAVVGATAYRDGMAEPGVIPPGGGAIGHTIYAGAANLAGAPFAHDTCDMLAILICDDVIAFAPADIAAIAALPAGSMHNL